MEIDPLLNGHGWYVLWEEDLGYCFLFHQDLDRLHDHLEEDLIVSLRHSPFPHRERIGMLAGSSGDVRRRILLSSSPLLLQLIEVYRYL